jgi:hypothetical protein
MVHRYTLEKYKGPGSRYTCPGCGKAKVFTRYIDSETGEHLAPHVGRCSREMNCAYHYKPKQYFQEHGIEKPKPVFFRQPQHPKPVSFIANDVFKSSLKGYEQNCFVQYLQQLFGAAVTRQLIARYFIGSSNYWNGATVFWQIDTKGRIRTGKIMLYSPDTGKRVKELYNHISWVHKALKQPEFDLKQCLFGEHLLRSDPQKPVAIVESEKTAIIASMYLPGFIWLAVGSLSNLTADRCKPLAGRKVILYPDLKAFDKWKVKAAELSHLARFVVSDLLERKASEVDKQQGFDLADYLMRLPVPEQAQVQPKPSQPPVADLFKAALFKEAKETGNGNADKWFGVYEKQGLTAREALTAVYQLSWEHGIEIEGEGGPATDPQQKNSDLSDCIKEKSSAFSARFPEKKEHSWELEISELDQYFNSIALPSGPIRLNGWTYISNVSETIKTHIITVRANDGNKTFLPFLNRLQEMKQYLSNIK